MANLLRNLLCISYASRILSLTHLLCTQEEDLQHCNALLQHGDKQQ